MKTNQKTPMQNRTASKRAKIRMLGLIFLSLTPAKGVVAQESFQLPQEPIAGKIDSDSGSKPTLLQAPAENTAQLKTKDSLSTISLDMYEYWVADTAESVSFRLHVRNPSDSQIVVTHVEPSCGCIMTTLQKSYARKGKDAEIYIGLMTGRMSDIQPYTVDVYTNVNPDTPLRLYIRKKLHEQSNSTE